jgi:hypothetical protein
VEIDRHAIQSIDNKQGVDLSLGVVGIEIKLIGRIEAWPIKKTEKIRGVTVLSERQSW